MIGSIVGVQFQKKGMINYSEDGDFHFFKFDLIFHLKNSQKKVINKLKDDKENEVFFLSKENRIN